jgi:hypothetical protein
MHHLHEINEAGNMTANRVQSFSSLDFDWTAPVTELAKEGVNVTSSTFNTSLSNEGTELSITYRVQVSFYHGNGTAMNGEQIIDVPVGGLKFSFCIDDWSFLSDANRV